MSVELHYILSDGRQQSAPFSRPKILIGSLPSNQVVLPDASVEPIHALVEQKGSQYYVTNLANEQKIFVNGVDIGFDSYHLSLGDRLCIGPFELQLKEKKEDIKIHIPTVSEPSVVPLKTQKETQREAQREEQKAKVQKAEPQGQEKEKDSPKLTDRRLPVNVLFTPRTAKPLGDTLQVVAFWGEKILNQDFFNLGHKGFEEVKLGSFPEAHFLSSDEDEGSESHVLVKLVQGGYVLNLLPHMTARIRRKEKAENVQGGIYEIGFQDIVHIRSGAMAYFLIFTQPPDVDLPPKKMADPLFMTLFVIFLMFYGLLMGVVATVKPTPKEKTTDDLWAIVHVKEKESKIEEVKKAPPPPVEPPPPPPKPVEPIPPPPKPVEPPPPPKPEPKKQEQITKAPLEKPKPVEAPKKQAPPTKEKAAGGGALVANQNGGERQGNEKTSVKGAEDGAPNKASGVNLSQLGLGAGSVKSFSGAGAIATNFKSSAGGAGGGSGSGAKTIGLGGLGKEANIGLSGSGHASQNWGNGTGAVGDSTALNQAFSGQKGNAQINVRSSDPLVSGGLTADEVNMVFRKNSNVIRHCYEQLLQRTPTATGRMKVKFQINGEGRVEGFSIPESGISDSGMKSCVESQITRWIFPKPRGGTGVGVTKAFDFNPA